MLDRDELCKYFTSDQIQDLLDLEELCDKITPGRIRRNRVRKVDPNHIPRPINSFMTYRTEKQALIRKFCPTANHRVISKMVAKWWHSLSSSQKASYVEQAKNAKAAHTEKYPDYTFRPKPKRLSAKKSVPIENAIPHVKAENPECSQTAQTNSNETTSERSLYRSPQSTDEQQHFHVNTYYAHNYNFNGLSNHNNVQPIQTLFQVGGDYSNQVFNEQSIPTQFFTGSYPTHSSQDLYYCHQPLSTQFMPGSYPMHASQEFLYGQAISYYPSPVDKSPSITVMQTTRNAVLGSNSTIDIDHVNSTPLLDDEITPLSQTMSTPVLGYPSTPFPMNTGKASLSPQHSSVKDFNSKSSCSYEDFSLYSDMYPAVCDPKSTLLEDCGFWGGSSN
ncbi:unnamed protein product [Mucor hiemalis]